MKTPDQVVADIDRRLTRTWAATSAGDPDPAAWPHAFPLGQLTGAALDREFSVAAELTATWRAWAGARGVELRVRTRRVMGTDQELPTHLVVDDIDTAARLAGGDWPDRLVRARSRAAVLTARFPHLVAPVRVLAAVDGLSDVDFDLLCRASEWFATHDAAGLTPRQVPIEGLHAKWLNTRQALLRELAGLDDLQLAPPHPARLHFTSLDPAHRRAGRRWHDSATVGDRAEPAYRPRVVVISENKDTAVNFPELDGGIAVEGVGRGGATAAAFNWLTRAETVVYWGDMDADGLEILDGFRAAGVPARSILMSPAAFERWERFGTNTDARGNSLTGRDPRPVPHLTKEEAQLYRQLTSPGWTRFRRIEQERIPLEAALAEVRRLHAESSAPSPNQAANPAMVSAPADGYLDQTSTDVADAFWAADAGRDVGNCGGLSAPTPISPVS